MYAEELFYNEILNNLQYLSGLYTYCRYPYTQGLYNHFFGKQKSQKPWPKVIKIPKAASFALRLSSQVCTERSLQFHLSSLYIGHPSMPTCFTSHLLGHNESSPCLCTAGSQHSQNLRTWSCVNFATYHSSLQKNHVFKNKCRFFYFYKQTYFQL